MSRLGVWQLRRLVLSYCEFSGSSRGVRCECGGAVFCRWGSHGAVVAGASGIIKQSLIAPRRRAFVGEMWPEFVAKNPELDATAKLLPGRHPNLTAHFLNGTVRTVGLRNATPQEVLRQAGYLRSSTGRKTSLQVKQRQVSRNPSIQGRWTPEVQDTLKAQA